MKRPQNAVLAVYTDVEGNEYLAEIPVTARAEYPRDIAKRYCPQGLLFDHSDKDSADFLFDPDGTQEGSVIGDNSYEPLVD